MTLVPWIKGQPLVRDVTIVDIDTLADSYVLKTSEVSGFAAEMACKRKYSKYRSIISSNYIFKGLASETLGPWCKEIPFREDSPFHSTWKRCKHSGHFSRFRIIIGNFCIFQTKVRKCFLADRRQRL
jgi:hypothetical protein